MSGDLAAARERIQRAYSPELLNELGHQLVDSISQHLDAALSGRTAVLNWNDPQANIEAAHRTLEQSDASSGSASQRFHQLLQTALERGHNLHSPRYIGHQVPASVPVAGLFDALGALTNQVMAIYEMGPWATAIERALVEKLGIQLGLTAGQFSGLITHGGSLANLTALLTARNVSLGDAWEKGLSKRAKPPVLVTHADSHYGVTRSAGILGLGTEQVIRVSLDSRRRMDVDHLEETLSRLRQDGIPIIAVSAASCATPIGAFDRLTEIAEVCQRHEVWMHVDGAHGGAVAFSDAHQHLIQGIEHADSVICDAHKMMFVQALCAFVFYKNGKHKFETFRQDAPYLFDPSAPGLAEIDSGMVTVECTKRAAALGLWGMWSMFGPGLFGDLIDVTFATTRLFYEMLLDAPDFEPLHEPQCNIQAFRYVPVGSTLSVTEIGELNRRIRRQIIESGEFYIVQTNLDGIGALRVSVMNPLTDTAELSRLMNTIRETAKQLAGI